MLLVRCVRSEDKQWNSVAVNITTPTMVIMLTMMAAMIVLLLSQVVALYVVMARLTILHMSMVVKMVMKCSFLMFMVSLQLVVVVLAVAENQVSLESAGTS